MRLRKFRTPLLALSLAGVFAACGGSSSETPEPARPDSWQLKLRHAQRQAQASSESGGIDVLPIRNLDEPTPAKNTWGNANRTAPPTSAPSSTAPAEPIPGEAPER